MNRALASGEDLAPLLADFAPDIVVEMGVLEPLSYRTRRVLGRKATLRRRCDAVSRRA